MDTVRIGDREVSRLILGSNMFSGFSHKGVEADQEMMSYYTCARIKETLYQAEAAGVNTVIARGDHHMIRVLREYWDEGGKIQWFGQTCPELGPPEQTIGKMAANGAPACHIHGGQTDFAVMNNRGEDLVSAVKFAREKGVFIGAAAHKPEIIQWCEEHLDVDYYMCCYYNPIPREKEAAHRAGTHEVYDNADREAMVALIQTLSKPVIHYKIMAAGRNEPGEAFDFAARHMRPGDACCVGVYTKDDPDMVGENARLIEEALARHGQ